MDEPRCTHCGEERIIEPVQRPRWAADGMRWFYCKMCGREFRLPIDGQDRGAADESPKP